MNYKLLKIFLEFETNPSTCPYNILFPYLDGYLSECLFKTVEYKRNEIVVKCLIKKQYFIFNVEFNMIRFLAYKKS